MTTTTQAQTWAKDNPDGVTVYVVATPSRTVGTEAVFEITEDALKGLMEAGGWSRIYTEDDE